MLVVYATKNGSTRQVAEAVAGVLRGSGTTVELAAAADARGAVTDQDLVVVGGALYNGRWHRAARRFLKRHRRELATVPVAVFGMGPREDRPESWARSRAQLDRALARYPWLDPVSVTVFGGVDPPRRTPRRDLRDWDAVRDWTMRTELLLAARSAPDA